VTNLGNGNSINGTATVTRGDGTNTTAAGVGVNTTAANLDLANNPFYRAFTTPVAPSTQAQGLPEMRGSGWVRDLRGGRYRENYQHSRKSIKQPISPQKRRCRSWAISVGSEI